MYNCLSRSIPEIHWHVAGTYSNQPSATNFSLCSSFCICLYVSLLFDEVLLEPRCFKSQPSHTSDLKIDTGEPRCQKPGSMGLVGPVSASWDWKT